MKNALKPEITTILFDFGKTIHNFDIDVFFNWLSREFGISRHYFWDMFVRSPDGLLYPYECGQSPEEFVAGFRKESFDLFLELKAKTGKFVKYPYFTDKEFFDALDNVFDSIPPKRDRLELMRELKRGGYGVYVLSNINKRHVAYLKGGPEYGHQYSRFREVFEIVDRFIASCDDDIQCLKMRPSEGDKEQYEKIFRKVLAIAGSEPEETVFVDDILDYVNVFRGMGGNAIHCTGSWTRVEAELYGFGVRWE